MSFSTQHRVLIATDGSPAAEAALATASDFPWPSSARARAVVARSDWLPLASFDGAAAVSETIKAAADGALKALAARWNEPEVVVVDIAPVEAILSQAREFGATLIVLGWRGHATFHRLLAGSVSRAVSAHAACPVLVVPERPRAVRRFVVGYDGCLNAERAVEFLCTLQPASATQAILVNVMQPVALPASVGILPESTRAQLRHALAQAEHQMRREAQTTAEAAVARLAACGWEARADLRQGAPLLNLLAAVQDHGADVLVLGARATSGLERALLGSVADGALNRSRVPVLLVR